MKTLLYGLLAVFTAIVLVFVQIQTGLTQNSRSVANLAKQITVIIDVGAPGSGVIVGKQGRTYYVLTAKHVVEDDATGGFAIIAPDQSSYPGENYRRLPGGENVDLAVVEFSSDCNYTVASLGDSEQVDQGTSVWVAGFPNKTQAVETRQLHTLPGEIRVKLLQPIDGGFTLSYTNPTEPGMSGGPILDKDGLLVGIHGKGDAKANEDPQKSAIPTRNYGIPINTFTRVVSQMGISVAKGSNPGISTPSNNPTDVASTCKQVKADYKYWNDKKRELNTACFFDEDPAVCSEEKAAAESIRQAERQWTQLGCSGPIWSLL